MAPLAQRPVNGRHRPNTVWGAWARIATTDTPLEKVGAEHLVIALVPVDPEDKAEMNKKGHLWVVGTDLVDFFVPT